jgi:hypothetical protein
VTLWKEGTLIDRYGVANVDGTGQAWEYVQNSIMYRVSGSTATNEFNMEEWTAETTDDVLSTYTPPADSSQDSEFASEVSIQDDSSRRLQDAQSVQFNNETSLLCLAGTQAFNTALRRGYAQEIGVVGKHVVARSAASFSTGEIQCKFKVRQPRTGKGGIRNGTLAHRRMRSLRGASGRTNLTTSLGSAFSDEFAQTFSGSVLAVSDTLTSLVAENTSANETLDDSLSSSMCGTITVRQISVDFTFDGLSYMRLSNNRTTQDKFTDVLKTSIIATLPNGYSNEDITILYAPGSIRAKVRIQPKAGSNISTLQTEMVANRANRDSAILAAVRQSPVVSFTIQDGRTPASLTITSTAPVEVQAVISVTTTVTTTGSGDASSSTTSSNTAASLDGLSGDAGADAGSHVSSWCAWLVVVASAGFNIKTA